MKMRSLTILLVGLFALGGCSAQKFIDKAANSEAHINERTKSTEVLMGLPAPKQPVPVVVYDFQDQTGQFKNNATYTDYSSAVTRGGYSILVKALLDAGHGDWFMVAERGGLKNLLQERQIVNFTRAEYIGANQSKLPPMIFGGTMIEGGIISYDSNVMTGGIGAVYLGIGGSLQYRRDLVTVYLRAISVESGRVLLAVNTSKTVYSIAVDGNFLRYLTVDNLFQSEAGFTQNEPVHLAVQQAIESAVYSLIMEGELKHLWEFSDSAAGERAKADYLARREGKGVKNRKELKVKSRPDTKEADKKADEKKEGNKKAESPSVENKGVVK